VTYYDYDADHLTIRCQVKKGSDPNPIASDRSTYSNNTIYNGVGRSVHIFDLELVMIIGPWLLVVAASTHCMIEVDRSARLDRSIHNPEQIDPGNYRQLLHYCSRLFACTVCLYPRRPSVRAMQLQAEATATATGTRSNCNSARKLIWLLYPARNGSLIPDPCKCMDPIQRTEKGE
jgi:hypothetical protein